MKKNKIIFSSNDYDPPSASPRQREIHWIYQQFANEKGITVERYKRDQDGRCWRMNVSDRDFLLTILIYSPEYIMVNFSHDSIIWPGRSFVYDCSFYVALFLRAFLEDRLEWIERIPLRVPKERSKKVRETLEAIDELKKMSEEEIQEALRCIRT